MIAIFLTLITQDEMDTRIRFFIIKSRSLVPVLHWDHLSSHIYAKISRCQRCTC